MAQIAARALALTGTQDGTGLVTTIAGGMRPGDYLPARTFGLAVHTAGLARREISAAMRGIGNLGVQSLRRAERDDLSLPGHGRHEEYAVILQLDR